MTLNIKIGFFIDFLGDFGLRHTFQEWQHPFTSGVCKYIVPNVSCWNRWA